MEHRLWRNTASFVAQRCSVFLTKTNKKIQKHLEDWREKGYICDIKMILL